MKKVLRVLNRVEDVLVCVLFAVMCLAVTAQMFCRTILKAPLLWTEEISRYSYVWAVFLLISLGERDGDHFCVDIFLCWAKGRVNDVFHFIEKLIGCVLFAFLFYWSVRFFPFQISVKSAALEFSMGFVAISLAIGYGLAFIRRMVHLIDYGRKIINPTRAAEGKEENK